MKLQKSQVKLVSIIYSASFSEIAENQCIIIRCTIAYGGFWQKTQIQSTDHSKYSPTRNTGFEPRPLYDCLSRIAHTSVLTLKG